MEGPPAQSGEVKSQPCVLSPGRVVTEAKNLKLEGDQLTMELERTRIQEA